MVRAGVPWSGAWRYGRSGCAGGEAPAGTGVDEPGEAGPSSRPPQVRVTQLWRKNMTVWRFTSRWLSALVFSAIAVCAFAQAPDAEFKPEVGQSGKDVVWVPSPQELVDKMLDMAKVTSRDYVIDLGSGDGRTVITAAKRGARAGRRVQPGHGRAVQAQRRQGGGERQGGLRRSRHFQERSLPRHRHHPVPADGI